MTSQTEHFGLTKLGPSEGIHAGTDRFASADRDVIDALLYASALHRHSGDPIADTAPESALVATAVAGAGTLPASTTISYCYTYTDPEDGETRQSPLTSITLPDPLVAPEAPTFSQQSIGGTLEPGQYFYVLSAYEGSSTVETKATNPVAVQIPAGTSTNTVTLTMPAVPAGADGFNIYRRGPSETHYQFLASTSASSYLDDGSVSTSSRTLPPENTTNSTWGVQLDLPAATPTIPVDNLWNIYRTYTSSFDDSHLVTLDEDTTTYTDVGNSTNAGSPPTVIGQDITPSKVLLTDAAEVQGSLPVGLIAGFPQTKEFILPGPVSASVGVVKWPIMFPEIEILGVKATLGVGSSPASVPVIADVNRYDSVATTTATIFTTQANRPTIPVGEEESPTAVPDVVAAVEGDYLTVDVDQAGGGATPTDSDLVVTVYFVAKFTSVVTDDVT